MTNVRSFLPGNLLLGLSVGFTGGLHDKAMVDKLEPSPFARFIMILIALTIVTRPLVKSKSVASCSRYEIEWSSKI